jgi:hypothetical protein
MQLEHALFIGVAFDDCVLTGGVTHPVPTAVFAIFQVCFFAACSISAGPRDRFHSRCLAVCLSLNASKMRRKEQTAAALATRNVLQRLAYGCYG